MTEIKIIYQGPIVKRKDTRSSGDTLYFSGNPCKNGHLDQRWTCSARCKECQKISTKRHIFENKEKYSALATERSKLAWAENKEELSAKHREWRIRNLEKRRIDHANWIENNKERAREIRLNWFHNGNGDYSKYNSERRAKKRNADGHYNSSDVKAMLERQKWKCADCKKSLKDGYHVDHIMPLALGGSNWPSNLQCLCPTCNVRKGPKHPVDWARINGRLV